MPNINPTYQTGVLSHLVKILSTLLIAIVVASGVYFWQQMQAQELKNKAVDGCSQTAENVAKGQFIQFVYIHCMQDKGYTTNLK